MFFDAMRRKNYSPHMEDMKTVVPIHNAVNERAWKEIREWERGWGAERYAFSGLPFLHYNISCPRPANATVSSSKKATSRPEWNGWIVR
jgi:cytochrome c heme-lyase